MTIRDLLEQASLDALGLLDDDERAEYEAAFRAASPDIQAQVRREQRRAADLEAILPAVDAPPGLRARVLAAVRKAIADVSTPVASLQPVAESHAHLAFARSTPFWRAACIGFATATVVLFGAFGWMRHENQNLAGLMVSNRTLEAFQKSAGSRALEVLAAGNLSDVSLIPAANDVKAGITGNLILNADTGEAVLFCNGLPPMEGSYRLVIKDGSQERLLQDFKASAGGIVALFVNKVEAKDLKSLAIIGPDAQGGPDKTILRADGA